MTLSGVFFTVYAYSRRKTLREHSSKFFQLLPILAPILLLIGIILFFAPNSQSINFSAVKVSQVLQATEGLAQVDFPESPEITNGKDIIDGFEVTRVTHSVDLAQGKVSLRFTVNEYPKEYPELIEGQVYEVTRNYLLTQGFDIVESLISVNNTREIIAFQSEKGARIKMCLFITDREIYRIMATSMNGHHNDSRVEKFISSFKINKTKLQNKSQ